MHKFDFASIKNKNLLDYDKNLPHALVTYRVQNSDWASGIIEEIAIGQSLGAWDASHVDIHILRSKVAKVVECVVHDTHFDVVLAFPYSLWHGRISWLLTLIFGKMSFYSQIQLSHVEFTQSCFKQNDNLLGGPKHSIEDIRKKLDSHQNRPLLMGILKPNVAMSAQQVCDLYTQAAQSGIDILKDDEIRFDASQDDVVRRVELVATQKKQKNLKTLYAVHVQITDCNYIKFIRQLEDAGADAFLINTWICGIDVLQNIRKNTTLPIFSHPALCGAFGLESNTATIHPRVTLAQLLQAAGADFSLFPSPYGKIGLSKEVALDVASHCVNVQNNHLKGVIPVPSAGIKPEHVSSAKIDFGQDFVLNAGTSIFASQKSITQNIQDFLQGFKN
jgi:2,3-diketo-5-methylthiopentyl-1-phosphate enolase